MTGVAGENIAALASPGAQKKRPAAAAADTRIARVAERSRSPLARPPPRPARVNVAHGGEETSSLLSYVETRVESRRRRRHRRRWRCCSARKKDDRDRGKREKREKEGKKERAKEGRKEGRKSVEGGGGIKRGISCVGSEWAVVEAVQSAAALRPVAVHFHISPRHRSASRQVEPIPTTMEEEEELQIKTRHRVAERASS